MEINLKLSAMLQNEQAGRLSNTRKGDGKIMAEMI